MWWRDTEEGGLGVRARGRCFFGGQGHVGSKQRSTFAGLECGSGST